uniref:Uncharacterized protein n=2 Tax=Ursus TaxID=9639 RepID=A0A452V8W4_URSMA
MVLPLKTLATQELTVTRKLSENTLQASSPVTLGIRISIVALLMMELFTCLVCFIIPFTVQSLSSFLS